MTTLVPWSSIEIGDTDIFLPSLPSLVVYTWYSDDEPESTVTYFWRDDDTGLVHHELVFVGPVSFEAAVANAKEEAPKRSVKRIHVKHARPATKGETVARGKAKPKQKVKRKVEKVGSSAVTGASQPKKATASKAGADKRKKRA